MIRRLAATAALCLVPAAAMADTMPQMDFKNPLTTDQIIWMVVILVALYLALSRWGLPEMGKVLALRADVIERDLAAARVAKTAADSAVAALNMTMKTARAHAQAEIATAIAAAKAKAMLEAASVSAMLDAQLAASEAEIATARENAMAAIRPVAEATTQTILARLTGQAPDAGAVAGQVGAVLAQRQAA